MQRLSALYHRRPSWLSESCLVFLGTLLVRLFVLLRATAARDFLPDHGDMWFYDNWARQIAAGAWTDHHAFYGMPLYAYMLAAIYLVVGHLPFAVVLLQIVAEAGTACWLYKIGMVGFARRSVALPPDDASPAQGRVIGLAAAASWTFFVPAQAFSSILMPTAFLVCAFWYLVWWIVRTRVRGEAVSPGACFALGLFVGVTAMMIANILFLIPLLLLAILWRIGASTALPKPRFFRAMVGAILLLAGVGCGTAPCWIHNFFVAHDPVLLSAHSGLNFWIGNNPQANGYPHIPPGLRADQQGMLLDSITWAERAAGRALTRAEVSAFWSAKAHAYIVEHPVEWLRLLGVKLVNFWSAFQYDDLSIITSLREDGALLPGLSFGIVAALALPGLGLAAWRAPAARWVVAAVLLHMASLMPVFITERYRLAAVPGLLLLGAYGVREVWRALTARRAGFCAAYGAALLVAATFTFWPMTDAGLLTLDDYNTALADIEAYNLASDKARSGDAVPPDSRLLDRAQAKLERVSAVTPGNAETAFALGNLWLAKGQRKEAKSYYRRTLELDARHSRAWNNLGVLAIEEQRWTLAETFLSRAVQIDGQDAKTFYLLAETRLQTHDRAGATDAIERAVSLKPGQARFQALRERIAAATP